MRKSIKIRLIPTKEQEILMNKSVGISRFSYNWGLAKWEEMYKEGLKPNSKKIKKIFNNTIKKEEEYKWLYEVSGQIPVQSFTDLQNSFNNFFSKKSKYPKFKSKKKSK